MQKAASRCSLRSLELGIVSRRLNVLSGWFAAVLLYAAMHNIPVAAQQISGSIDISPGTKAILVAKGYGTQIYSCTAAQDGAKWSLKGPDAKLMNAGGAQIGTHFAGPTWKLNDGSSVSGELVASQPSPETDSIAWLLLRAKAGSGTGTLTAVTFIRRTETHGGVPAAADCKNASDIGKTVQIPYSATYTFYAD